MRIPAALIAVVTLMLGCGGAEGGSGVEVTREQYGAKWPFTVEKGTVDCVQGQAAIFRTGGKTYQLNGFATSRGYAPLEPIWRDNPEIPGAKISVGEMIDLALKQCS